MPSKDKEYVIVKGRIVPMNDAAFRLALKHFGATKDRPEQKLIPMELIKMPKLQILPKKITPVVVTEVKAEVVAPVVAAPIVVTPTEVKTEIPVIEKKVTRPAKRKPVKR